MLYPQEIRASLDFCVFEHSRESSFGEPTIDKWSFKWGREQYYQQQEDHCLMKILLQVISGISTWSYN